MSTRYRLWRSAVGSCAGLTLAACFSAVPVSPSVVCTLIRYMATVVGVSGCNPTLWWSPSRRAAATASVRYVSALLAFPACALVYAAVHSRVPYAATVPGLFAASLRLIPLIYIEPGT
ncbi:hypothetical protein [Actinoplanes cyaneus]|uniref:hypothetical protein n=1 Tax=Actinoplanes cyaneus TaxID=52696 RepID=UPI0019426358|nr:hypothetical protein [Actinoplanes cyaneus]MCW2144496.1 hypothetical protein [Actinoplanes cyaneus]